MTYEEKIEAAAERIHDGRSQDYYYNEPDNEEAFKACAQWCRDNPPPETLNVVRVTKEIIEAFKNGCGSDYCTNPNCGCFSELIKAIEAFEKRGEHG